jgi:hypothetical protein
MDALLGGGRLQLHAAGPSDNNARPFGQTVDILFRIDAIFRSVHTQIKTQIRTKFKYRM